MRALLACGDLQLFEWRPAVVGLLGWAPSRCPCHRRCPRTAACTAHVPLMYCRHRAVPRGQPRRLLHRHLPLPLRRHVWRHRAWRAAAHVCALPGALAGWLAGKALGCSTVPAAPVIVLPSADDGIGILPPGILPAHPIDARTPHTHKYLTQAPHTVPLGCRRCCARRSWGGRTWATSWA